MREQKDLIFYDKRLNPDFLSLDLPSLKTIKFLRTKLTKPDKNLFVDLPNLVNLDLSSNSLVELDKNLFKNLKALIQLDLSENKITK